MSLLAIPIISPLIVLLVIVAFMIVSFVIVLLMLVPIMISSDSLQLQVFLRRICRYGFFTSKAILLPLEAPHSPCDSDAQGADDKSQSREDNSDCVVDWEASTGGEMRG